MIRRFLPWTVLLVYAVLCVVLWVESAWRPEWDGALYLLTGQAIAAGEGYSYLGQPFFLRPPGLAWMLSLLVTDGGYDFVIVNVVLMAWAAAAVAAVFAAIRPLHGTALALAVAVLTGTCPLFVGSFNFVLAEFPAVALLYGSIGLLHQSAERRKHWWVRAVAGGAMLAAAGYMRTMVVVLLPGVLLLGARRDKGPQRLRGALPAAVAVLLLLPWLVHAGRAAADAPRPSEQLLLFSYSTALLHVDPGDPGSPTLGPRDWMERAGHNAAGIARSLTAAAIVVDQPVFRIAMVALLILGWGLAIRTRPSLLEWLAGASMLVLLVYFVFAERLVLPLVPLLYLYLLLPFELGARRLAKRRGRWIAAGPWVIAAGLLVANATRLPAALAPQDHPIGGGTLGDFWQDTRNTAEWITDNTPPDAVILCRQAPHVELLTGRRAYTYRFLRDDDPLERYGVDYVVIDSRVPPALMETVTRSAERRWQLGREAPGAPIRVYRVRRTPGEPRTP